MIISKERIRATVASIAKDHPGKTEPEVHHLAAAQLGIEADTVRIVMQEQARQDAAQATESEN